MRPHMQTLLIRAIARTPRPCKHPCIETTAALVLETNGPSHAITGIVKNTPRQ